MSNFGTKITTPTTIEIIDSINTAPAAKSFVRPASIFFFGDTISTNVSNAVFIISADSTNPTQSKHSSHSVVEICNHNPKKTTSTVTDR